MDKQIDKARHSLSHLMAMAVLKKYPKTMLAIGPVIDNGFYYDFDLPKGQTLSEANLPQLEKEMKKLIKQSLSFTKTKASKKEALKKVSGPYKQELIEELPKGEIITFYQSGDFVDLCSGPHISSTKEINPEGFKLIKSAGAYWRGNEKNKMLTRIYGVAFGSKKELDEHLKMLAEAENRDHRKLGKELELFAIDPLVGSGLPLFLPKGTVIYNSLLEFLKEEQFKLGYQFVTTPHLGRLELYKTSGHYPYYQDSQYPPIKIDNEQFLLKPMNCPHHIAIFKAQKHSYKELPVRLVEFGTVYRYEKSGELTGLTRARGFTIDDAHLFVTQEQIEQEFLGVTNLVLKIFKTLDFQDFRVRIGTREPNNQKYIGDQKIWDLAEKLIVKAIKGKFDYTIEPGDAAFYGPKLDFLVKDVLGRSWQLGTVQLDFNLPERFDLSYTDNQGKKQRPVIIHRAPFGSLERFIGILIEHFAGAFPLWLSPVQVKIVSVGSGHKDYCEKLASKLISEKIRVETDLTNETVGNKIRKAISGKAPYTLVIGDREVKSDKLMVRVRGQEKLLQIPCKKFVEKLNQLIAERSLKL